MNGPLLELSEIKYRWPGRSDVSVDVPHFQLEAGETALLLGRSGSGKSTLLSLICGTILPDSGSVKVAHQDLSALSGQQRDKFRAENIGIIFQQFNLLPFGTVRDNILLPLHFANKRRQRIKDRVSEAKKLCSDLGLPEGIIGEKASDLSVGQQQRVAVARALIGHPPLIIADEPTSALDADSQSAFLDLLFRQVRQSQASLLMVSHDARLGQMFDRVVRMESISGLEGATA